MLIAEPPPRRNESGVRGQGPENRMLAPDLRPLTPKLNADR